MTSTNQTTRLPLHFSVATSLQTNGFVLVLTTIIGLAGASPLLLQKPESENSNVSHTWLLAQSSQTNKNENTEPGKRNNGTPDPTDSTASAK